MVDITVPVKIDDDEQEIEDAQAEAAAAPVNPFDEIMALEVEETPARVAKDIQNLLPDIDYDGYAKATATAKALPGSNADDVYEDPAPYQAAEKKNIFDQIMDESPGTARFYSRPQNAKVAGDAAEELGTFEQLWRGVSGVVSEQVEGVQKGFKTGEAIVEMSGIGGRLFSGAMTPQDEARLKVLEMTQRKNKSEAWFAAAGEQLPILGQILGTGVIRGTQVAVPLAGAVALAGQAGPQIAVPEEIVTVPAAAATGFAVGMRAGTLEAAFELERNLAMLEYHNFRDADGKRMDTDIARGAAVAAGTLNAALETTGLAAIVKRIPGLDRLYQVGGRTAVNRLVGDMAARNKTLADRLKKFGVAYGAGVSIETVTEGLQELSTLMFGEVAKAISDQEFKSTTIEEAAKRTGEALFKGFQAATVLSAPGPTVQLGIDTVEARREKAQTAKDKAEIAKKANELARDSKLAERARDVAEEHRADVFRENGVDKVTIDAEVFTTYMQDEADPDFAASLGMTEEGLNEALELGGEIAIDAEGYAHLIGRESYDQIADHVRFDEDGMTALEAQEFEQNALGEQLTQFYEEFESFDVEKQTEINTIRQEVEAQVKAAGRSDNEAQFIGQLLGERYATRGERAGMSPLEMFRRDNVRMVGPGQNLPGFDMLDLAIDKLRGGVPAEQFLRLRRTPMINALIERGGIDPTSRLAGELRARDINEKTMRRLFVEGGLGEADNLVQSEFDFLDAEVLGDTGYIDQNLLIDAIEADVRGTPYRSLEEQRQIEEYEGDVTELQRIMDDAGLTAEATPAEIRAAVNEAMAGTRTFEQTDTTSEAFKRWFKNSKVVDESGEPLVVYHGSRSDIENFDPTVVEGNQGEFGQTGMYFTEDPDYAQTYAMFAGVTEGNRGRAAAGQTIYPVYLSIQNPLVIKNPTFWESIKERIRDRNKSPAQRQLDGTSETALITKARRDELEAQGYDGIINERANEIIAFRPTQIKSAFNQGTFDPDDPRVLYQRGQLDHPDRISTRQPTTKFATEDPLTEDLVIDLDTMKRDRNTFEYNMREIVGRYRNVRATDANLAADEMADKFVDHVVSNLLYLFDSVPADTRERSRLWYDGARALTDRWSAKYNVPDRVVAGVLAALSPQKDWFMNVSLGERVLDIMTNQQNHRFDDAMFETARSSVLAQKKNGKPLVGKIIPAYKKALKEIRGKTLSEVTDPKHKAIWLRIYDETYNDRRHRIVTPEGDFADWARGTVESPIDDMGVLTPVGEEKKTGWGSFSEITKAVNVILDPSPENISIEMGDKHKVRNFFNNILSPNAPQQDVTIDTHAVAAALLQPLSGGSREVHHNFGSSPMVGKKPPGWMAAKNYKGNGVEGLYGIYAEAYRKAASERGVSARQMQSITWEAARGLFTPAYKQDATNVEAIEKIWDDYRNGKSTIEEAREAVVQHAGGINPPEWEGRDSGVIGGEFNSSYSEELSESGIPGFEPGLSPSGTGSRFTGILAGQGLEPSGVFLQRAYHGTPHRFTKFDISKIGTGEGAQAFGWGLYFAERKQVAQFYREALSGKADPGQYGFNWDGVILTPSEMAEEARAIWMDDPQVIYDLDAFRDIWNDAINSGLMIPEDATPADFVDRGIDVPLLKDSAAAQEGFNEFFDELAARGSIPDQEISRLMSIASKHASEKTDIGAATEQSYAQGYLEAYEIVESFEIKPEQPGRLFEVEIPDDDQFLNFETPIKEQSQLVIDAVSQIELDLANRNARRDGTELLTLDDLKKYEAYRFDRTGEEFYRELAQELGTDQAVSLALAAKGVAGNRYLDFEKTDKFNYVVYDDSLVNVIRYEAPLNRGAIELRAHETVIRLGKDADPSTFLHENGHLFLEQLKSDAREFGTEQLVEDWNTTRNWWASNSESLRREAIRYAKDKGDQESANVLDKMSGAAVRAYVRTGDLTGGVEYAGKGNATAPLQYLTEAMHEQYARGFEDYLRTGQAPSVQLQSAFNRFRGWLVSIYNAIRRRLGRDILDVQYSREVAETVDRLLASDTDIELVREQYDLKALYDSAEEAGMTPKQFERYQLQVARAVEQSKTRQLKKHLNEVEREQKEFWKSEGEEIAGGIRAELAQEPAYKALYTLTQKALADGTPLPEGFAIDRLDRKAVIKVLQSAASLQRLPKVKNKAVYTTKAKESGMHPDVAADMFGFRDAMEMLQAMSAARPFEEVVQERVDAQLKEKYGDMRNDGSAVEEAIESVHIDETAEVLTAELNALRDSKDKMKPAFVRQWAREKIGGRKVSELRPNEFLQAEKRHAKEAGKLLRQGDRLGAQRAKFKQLMNFYMAKEAIKARNEITSGRKYFSRFTARRKNFKTLAADYVDQIKNILSNYQFGPRPSKDIQAWVDFAKAAEENDGSVFDIPQEILDADGRTNYQDLTLDEFRTLRDTIKAIEAQGRLARTIEVEGQRVYLDDAETEITDRLEDRPMTKRGIGKQRGYPDSLKGKWNEWKDKRMANLASFDASLVKIEFLAFQVDGEKGGPFHKFFFQTFADAEAARNDMVAKVGKPIMDAIKNMPRKMQRALGTKIYVPELDQYFSRSEIIMMALNTGNESNRDKLIRGSARDVYDSGALNEELLDKILDNLVLEEWQFVQTVWDSFQEMYPDVEAVFRKENGRSPEAIEAVPFEREFDGQTYEFRGGYFPMMYDQSRSAQGMDISEKTALEALQAQSNQAGVFSGMTKERNETFAVPVLLDITAIPQHLERTAHYITHYEAVRTTTKLLRRENLNKAIVQTMGEEYFKVLNNWLGAVAANQAPQVKSEFWSKVIKFFRTNSTIAIMGLSFTTGIAQTLGLFTSIDALSQQPDGKYNFLVGKKWLINGMFHYLKNPSQSIRMIKEMSGEMRHRIYNTDRDVSYAMRQFERTAAGQSMMAGKYKEFQRFTMMAIAGIQVLMVDYPTWMGAYNKALAEGKAPGDAVNYADSIIRTSQTAGGLKDMSAAQMNETMAPFMMFYSFFNVLYNIERQIAGGLKENGIQDVPQAAARVFIVMALPTIIENIYKDKWPDEDEDEDGVISGWDYAKWTAEKTAFFALSSIPLFRDIAGGAFTGFDYSLSPMDSLGDSTVKAIRNISKILDEDDPEMTASRVKSIVGAIGFGIGFPVVQLNREVKTYFKMQEGEDVDWYDWLVGYREPASSAFKD